VGTSSEIYKCLACSYFNHSNIIPDAFAFAYKFNPQKNDQIRAAENIVKKHCSDMGQRPHTVGFHPNTEAYAVIEWVNAQEQSGRN